jgi:hypothetical protein
MRVEREVLIKLHLTEDELVELLKVAMIAQTYGIKDEYKLASKWVDKLNKAADEAFKPYNGEE